MASVYATFSEFGWRRRLFTLVVLITLGLVGFNFLMVILMQLKPGFLGMTHFQEPHHRVHDLTFGFLVGTTTVGMLSQLRSPSKNVAGQLVALFPWIGLMVGFVLTDTWVPFDLAVALGGSTLLATVLHPTGRAFFQSFSIKRANWAMLALVIIAAVPLLAFGATNIELQRTVTNDHAALGHYGFMAAFSLTIIGAGVVASLRPDGWWLSAWVAGFLPVLLGLTSLVYPNVDSSLSLNWAIAAIAWGVAFVAAAEITQDVESPTLLGKRGALSKSERG